MIVVIWWVWEFVYVFRWNG